MRPVEPLGASRSQTSSRTPHRRLKRPGPSYLRKT